MSTTPNMNTPSLEEMDVARGRFRREHDRFVAALPGLLRSSDTAGRWIVFLDGTVQTIADDRETAHRWAVAHLDRLSGFVVAEVSEPRVARIGGARRSAP